MRKARRRARSPGRTSPASDQLRVSRRRSALGLPEVAALAAALAAPATAVLCYLFLLVPQRMRASDAGDRPRRPRKTPREHEPEHRHEQEHAG